MVLGEVTCGANGHGHRSGRSHGGTAVGTLQAQRSATELRAVRLARRYGVNLRAAVGIAASAVVLVAAPPTTAQVAECAVLIVWSAVRLRYRSYPQRGFLFVDVALALAVALIQPLTERADAVVAQTTLSLAFCGASVTALVWSFGRRGAALASLWIVVATWWERVGCPA